MSQPTVTRITVDTNVVLDVASWHDLMKAFDRRDFEAVEWRRRCARDALSLFVHCHENSIDSLSVDEFRAQLLVHCDPAADAMEDHFVRVFVWFVKDYLLYRWDWKYGTNSTGLKSNAADAAVLELAKTTGTALITKEDFTPKGLRPKPKRGSLRKKATDAGVPVYHPREWLVHRRALVEAEFERFLERWDCLVPLYITAQRARDVAIGDSVAKFAERLRQRYEWLMFPERYPDPESWMPG